MEKVSCSSSTQWELPTASFLCYILIFFTWHTHMHSAVLRFVWVHLRRWDATWSWWMKTFRPSLPSCCHSDFFSTRRQSVEKKGIFLHGAALFLNCIFRCTKWTVLDAVLFGFLSWLLFALASWKQKLPMLLCGRNVEIIISIIIKSSRSR